MRTLKFDRVNLEVFGPHSPTMDYDSMSVLNLKTLCKERGLRVSGNKAEVIIRLMENDEAGAPVPQQVIMQPMQMQPQIIHLVGPQGNGNAVGIIFGLFITLYGLFRMGMAMFFNAIDEEVFFFESALAWLIGMSFIVSGIFTMMGFRNGLFIAIGTLVISGTLSLIFHDEWSPLSIGIDGMFPITYSLMCSGMCILLASMPLIIAGDTLKPGWPEGIQNIIEGVGLSNTKSPVSTDKVAIECPLCDTNIKIPADYSGDVLCPACKKQFTIE